MLRDWGRRTEAGNGTKQVHRQQAGARQGWRIAEFLQGEAGGPDAIEAMKQQTDTILDEILAARRERIGASKEAVSLTEIENAARRRKPARDFVAALSRPGLQVIAELKKASPSRGLLRAGYQVSELARSYQAAGAAAISILTEPDFFDGSVGDLETASGAVSLPCLRKDFIIDAYQVVESAAGGADALLLIVADLTDRELEEFSRLGASFGMAALVEVHTESELDRSLAAGARLIGVNNRDLRSLEVKLETSLRLRERIPPACVTVSESGIQSSDDLKRLEDAGFDAVLIGEHLMLSTDPGAALAALVRSLRH